MKKATALVLLIFLTVQLFVQPSFQADLTCGEVVMTLHKCVSYMTGSESAPSPDCCEGLQRLRSLLITHEDKELACTCIRHATRRIHNLKEAAVKELPSTCHVELPFALSTYMDCNR
ncbi:non-specific lipid-transfer protein A-like [Nymphaea colorata]|nr:non-specific lipid-transfer protein A-like [Nymphaea colorata]